MKKPKALCSCSICKQSRRIDRIIKSRDPDKLISVINELHDQCLNLGLEVNVYEAIMNGTWPSSEEQLEEALRKVKGVDDQTQIRL